jgi:hypothetical protein
MSSTLCVSRRHSRKGSAPPRGRVSSESAGGLGPSTRPSQRFDAATSHSGKGAKWVTC